MIIKQDFGQQSVNQFSIEIPWSIPSKKNLYEIHFAPAFWKSIKSIASLFKKNSRTKRLYWISPAPRVKQFEKNLSTWFSLYLPDYGNLPITVTITIDQKNDVDNIGGAVLDALEKSRKIRNDRQVVGIHICRVRGITTPTVTIETALEP